MYKCMRKQTGVFKRSEYFQDTSGTLNVNMVDWS